MKKKIFRPSSFIFRLFGATAFITFYILQTGCNDTNKTTDNLTDQSKQPGVVSNDWVTMKIKFKPGTTSEMRYASIRAIEKLLVDSVKALRDGKYPNYSPTFMMLGQPFGDSLQLDYKVYTMSASIDTIDNPNCRCIYQCGICETLMKSTTDTSSAALPYRNISYISFLDQDRTKQIKK